MRFLDLSNDRDFPYYNGNPKLSKTAWAVLLLSLPIAYIFYSAIPSAILGGAVFCLVVLIPLLYFSNWDYSLFIRKPTKNEIIFAFLLFIGYGIYSMVVGSVLEAIIPSPQITAEAMGISVESTVGLIFSMMGEELTKFIPLMFLMRVIYKFSDNRKLAVIVSSTLVLIGFGLLHYNPPYLTLPSVLILQGFGSIFEVYGYLKTKNIIVPYISHLLTDGVAFILILMV